MRATTAFGASCTLSLVLLAETGCCAPATELSSAKDVAGSLHAQQRQSHLLPVRLSGAGRRGRGRPLEAGKSIASSCRGDGRRGSPSRALAVALRGGGGVGGGAPPVPRVSGDETPVSMQELTKFTVPLLLIWFSNPIMSLLDTAVVGMRSSVELAALGPATAICDRVAYVITFLASVTTSLAATALAAGDHRAAAAAATTGLAAAVITGTTVTALLCRYGRAILTKFLGGADRADAAILGPALQYVQLRALGYVAVTVSMVLQASCLAAKDLRTPIVVVAIQSFANLFGDLFLVFVVKWGIRGAAAATAAAQWAGAVAMAASVLPKLARLSPDRLRAPTLGALAEFAGLGLPTMLALTLQTATCGMLAFAASACETAALAAHQVMYTVFNLFCVIGEALSQTVQAYLPALLRTRRASLAPAAAGPKLAAESGNAGAVSSDDGSRGRGILLMGSAARQLMWTLLTVSAALGLVDAAGAAVLTTLAPFAFTPDHAVWAWMRRGAPLLAACLVVHALTFAMQGALLATRDVTSLALVYASASAFFGHAFVRARGHPETTVPGLWTTFAVFHVWRAVLFAAVLGFRHRGHGGGVEGNGGNGGNSMKGIRGDDGGNATEVEGRVAAVMAASDFTVQGSE
ncbi:unnamed protein product [Phaeothamnion confervicola]